MTEDADRKVDIEIYADDTEGNKVHRTGLLSGSGIPLFVRRGKFHRLYKRQELGREKAMGGYRRGYRLVEYA